MHTGSDASHLDWAHPVVRDWFQRRFGTPTEPQELGWPHILAGHTTLISAPTGSGKTLAAFLACIERLVRKAFSGELQDRTEVLYVSPLRALSNDIQKNLQAPIAEIGLLAADYGLLMPEIRTAVRTGDTPARERQSMIRKPPHILVTTPESLYILLTAEKSRAVLQHVETVIVDEIHAVADDKRGAHLALSLERLEALTLQKPVRIGLSATQKPIEEVAQFLSGAGRPSPVIVDVGHRRKMELSVEVPDTELGPVASHELWNEVHERITELIEQHRSTLIFVNTRKMAERTTHLLAKKLGEDAVAAHHGSLSRKLRLAAERKLKNGELKALVATASLELGIDIGTIDLVCQVGSPRSIAVALQRVGRSGHWRGAVPKGRLFPTTRDELLECAALTQAVHCGDLDRLEIPEAPLDILTQQITATCATGDWREDQLFELVRGAYPYRNLQQAQFDAIIEMLSEGIAASRGRVGAYLHRDRVQGILRGRRGARFFAITCGGAIPEIGSYTVVAEPDGNVVGTLDEDFAVESNAGDIILLGNMSWKIRHVQSATARVLVEDAHGAAPTVPFWRGEAPARTPELSAYVGNLRQRVDETFPIEATPESRIQTIQWLKQECGVDDSGADQIAAYIAEGRAVLGAVPTQKRIIAERFFDEGGGMQLVLHAPFGGRINKAWGLALRKRFCRSFNLELQAAATDDGVNISLTEQHSFPLADVFRFLHTNTVENVLTQAAFASPLFGTRWRWDAMRALAIRRFQNGKKVPLQILRMKSEDLLASVFPDAAACQDNVVGEIEMPDHPLVKETMKDVLQEAMDLQGLIRLIGDIQSGAIECVAVDTPIPSAFSHEILNANPYAYLDDAPLEERRARAVSTRRTLPDSFQQGVGLLDSSAIRDVVDQAWPDVRNAEELHDALLSLIVLPETRLNDWETWAAELLAQRRAGIALVEGSRFWFAAERMRQVLAVFPNASIIAIPAAVDDSNPSREDAVLSILRGWMFVLGPVCISEIATLFQLPPRDVETSLLRLESSGSVLRGHFRNHISSEIEWCDRGLLARIHRITLGSLRKQIEPVTAAQFLRWLCRWQHVAPGTQLRGERGAAEILRQLQGFEIPARAWEKEVLARRIADYHPSMLDRLCWSGVIGWGRFSVSSSPRRRLIPGSAAPITFFLREECDWLPKRKEPLLDDPALSPEAELTRHWLQQRGALFLPELVRCTGLTRIGVEKALWELVTVGVVTADGFDSLRSLLDQKKKKVAGRSGTGRWSLLYSVEHEDAQTGVLAACKMVLARYGVVFRDLLQRETLLPRWREMQLVFRRMEDRGEVRGGRFVHGFTGEQYALPLAVDSLRAIRRMEPRGEFVSLSPADPLNLTGILVPGERIPAVALTSVNYRDGITL